MANKRYNKNKLKRIFFVKIYYKMNIKRGIFANQICKNINLSLPMSYSTMDRYLSLSGINKQIKELGIQKECEEFANNKIQELNNLILFKNDYTVVWNSE